MDDLILLCTICNGNFSLEHEGGTRGQIGMLPVNFCPTCMVGIYDFAEERYPQEVYGDSEED